MYKIIVKEVDRYHSKYDSKKYISEYLIYVKHNDTNVTCNLVKGEKEKDETIFDFLNTYFDEIDICKWINVVENITNYKK